MTAIDIRGLTKRFGDHTAVDGLTLSIEDGELFSLLGVNGAGKTTTIRMLTGLLPPDDGDAELLGSSLVSEPGVMNILTAVSPQESAIAPNLTVEENLRLMAGIYSIEKDYARENIPQIMAAFGLVLLVMFSLFNIPADVYRVENFAPGIVIFAYSFVSMFGGTLMAADRESSFFARLAASPMRARDFILGYAVLNGGTAGLVTDILVLLAWAMLMFVLASVFFRRRLRGK